MLKHHQGIKTLPICFGDLLVGCTPPVSKGNTVSRGYEGSLAEPAQNRVPALSSEDTKHQ